MAAADPQVPEGTEVAPETVSPHQIAALSRILGLNPDNTVAMDVRTGHVDVTVYRPPAGARHPALRVVRYLVER